MRVFFYCSILLSLALTSCDSKQEEAEIDYDEMVMNEPIDEWTSISENKVIAGDIGPDQQERLIFEQNIQ